MLAIYFACSKLFNYFLTDNTNYILHTSLYCNNKIVIIVCQFLSQGFSVNVSCNVDDTNQCVSAEHPHQPAVLNSSEGSIYILLF